MAPEQNRLEESAQAAAQKATDELAAARRERDMHEPSSPGRRTGIFGSVQESARSLLGAVRDTFSGGGVRDTATAHDSRPTGAMGTGEEKLGEYGSYASHKAEEGKESARGMADAAAGKTKETKDAAAEKTREMAGKATETKDAAAEKTREMADTAADKAMETKDAAAEKARGAAETVTEKAKGAKDEALVTAEGAREYMTDKKEDAQRALAGSAKDSKGETNESAWQQGQDVRRRAAEKAEEARQRTNQPPEEERSKSATENILGSAQGLTQAFKEKMTMPTDVVERKLAEKKMPAAAGGGDARNEDDDDVMMRVKAADQMTGTGFNDVGKMGEEGTGMKAAASTADDDEEDVMLRVKAADQMTGTGSGGGPGAGWAQGGGSARRRCRRRVTKTRPTSTFVRPPPLGTGFNDVGKMGEEGTGMGPALRKR